MECTKEIFKKIASSSEAQNITWLELINSRKFNALLNGKFAKLDNEISYNVSYGNAGQESFVTSKSNYKLTIIEDIILSKFNSLIFHSESKDDLCNNIKLLLGTEIKFIPGGLFDSTKFKRIKTSKSERGSIEVSSMISAFRKLGITEENLKSCGFFGLFDDKKHEDDKKNNVFLNVIKSQCARLDKPKYEPKSAHTKNYQFEAK